MQSTYNSMLQQQQSIEAALSAEISAARSRSRS